jgi:hypothetical protein
MQLVNVAKNRQGMISLSIKTLPVWTKSIRKELMVA